jgi:uroporphyrinogen-III synthase
LVLASPRAPQRFVDRCHQYDATGLLSLPAAAVGTSTARAAEDAGLRVELIGPGTGQGLAAALIDRLDAPTHVIFACGRDRRPELPGALDAAGHTVLPVEVYRMDPTPPRELPPLGPSLEAVVLTSPRSATLYLEGVGGIPLPCQHWAFGPTTQQAAGALGIECRIPPESNMKSLAEELCKI